MTELGKRLKEKRNEQNLTLEELQNITKIQKRYLQAIEEGNYDILPGRFYARAFIKQYADAVGLDPDQLFDEFSSDIPKTSHEDFPERLSRARKKTAPVSSSYSSFMALLPKLLVAALIVGVAVTIYLMLLQSNNGQVDDNRTNSTDDSVETELGDNTAPQEEEGAEEQEQESVTEPVQEEPVDEEPAAPKQELTLVSQDDSRSTPVSTYELTGADEFIVEFTATPTGRCYLGIKNGIGKSFFSEEITNGRKESFDLSKEEEIEFNVGNITGVEMTVNGEAFTFPFDNTHQKVIIVNKQGNE